MSLMKRWSAVTLRRYGLWLLVGVVLSLMVIRAERITVWAQALSPTPDRIVIPTAAAPTLPPAVQSTDLPTFTPTSEGQVQLEAKEGAGDVNVRREPDPDSDVVGTISFGERYTVLGRYYRWLQLRFEPSPNRTAYVFDELVNIIGDPAQISDITEVTPTPNNPFLEATATFEALLQSPDGVLTITANAREIAPPGSTPNPAEDGESSGIVGVLPTFTYPPNVVAQMPTQAPAVTATPDPARISLTVSDGVAPVAPIVILGTLGVVGMLISLILRRT